MKGAILCVFVVFMAYAYGQTYVGRRRGVITHPKPVLPKTVHPKPIAPKPMYPKPLFSRFRGGGRDDDLPLHIRQILGSTLGGRTIFGGMGQFPRNGGAGGGPQFANGLRSGWGSLPEAERIPAVSGWVDPLDGRPFPIDYAGEDLGHRIVKNQQHQVAKSSHVAASIGMPVVGSPVQAQIQHNIRKESDHIARKSVGGAGIFGGMGAGINPIPLDPHTAIKTGSVVDPVGHSIRKSTGDSFGMGGLGPVVDPVGHSIDKSMGVVDSIGFSGVSPVGLGRGSMGPIIDPVGHDIDKSLGMAPVGIGAGSSVGFGPLVDPVGHSFDKASAGVGMIGGGLINDPMHNVAKATGGVQVLPPTGHEIRKSVGFEIAAGRPLVDPIGHSMVKSSVGQGMSPFGTVNDPVHNVRKVGATGIASIGHDPLAADIGLGMAQQAAHQSSKFVDIGSHGGVSMGDPLANAAAQGLAREAVHVAGKTLDLASSGGIGIGHPNIPVKPKAPKGYGRQRIRGQAVRAW